MFAMFGGLLAGKGIGEILRRWQKRRPLAWMAYMTLADIAVAKAPVVGEPLALAFERMFIRPYLKMPTGQISAFDTPLNAAIDGVYKGSEQIGRGSIDIFSGNTEKGIKGLERGGLNASVALSVLAGQGLLSAALIQGREVKSGYGKGGNLDQLKDLNDKARAIYKDYRRIAERHGEDVAEEWLRSAANEAFAERYAAATVSERYPDGKALTPRAPDLEAKAEDAGLSEEERYINRMTGTAR